MVKRNKIKAVLFFFKTSYRDQVTSRVGGISVDYMAVRSSEKSGYGACMKANFRGLFLPNEFEFRIRTFCSMFLSK